MKRLVSSFVMLLITGISFGAFVFQGLLFSTPECLKAPVDAIRLWNHESDRVYRDKLIDDKDIEHYDKIQHEFNRKFFDVSSLKRRP